MLRYKTETRPEI